MKNNKKGISAIVATVMIILITVAAVTIVWSAIIPMIGDQLEAATICQEAVTSFELPNEGYTCYNSTHVKLQIRRSSSDFELADMQVLISAQGSTTSKNLIGGSTINGISVNETHLLSTTGTRIYTMNLTGVSGTPESIQIAPIITIGNSQEKCDVAVTRELRSCA